MTPRPFVVGFYRVEPFTRADDTATVAALQQWCQAEGYTLGVPYRDEDYNGAFETMLEALLGQEYVIGVIIPDLTHLGTGDIYAERVSDITATGKALYLLTEAADHSPLP